MTTQEFAAVIAWKWPGARVVIRDAAVERWDGPMAQPSGAEIAQAVLDFTPSVARTTQFTATSRQKDVLATCAQIVRARGITAWNAMTLQQKVTATLAEADVWVAIREFIETNL
jgi:hypothetical protein